MSDYKTDQDRFFDNLRDLADFTEAAETEQRLKNQTLIDKLVKAWVAGGMSNTEQEAREEIVRNLKERGKLAANYTYPVEPSN